jgi:uncharacterized protein (DUF3820 family)
MQKRLGYPWFGALFLLIGLIQQGCGFTREPAPTNETQLGSALELSCLDEIPTKLSLYMEGGLQDPIEIEKPFLCIDRALDTFTTFTRGENASSYQAAELRGFLNRYLLKTSPFSETFMSSAMEMKVALLGGSRAELTRAELTRVRGLFTLFKQEAVRLRTIMPILAGHVSPDAENLRKVRVGLNETVSHLAARMQTPFGRYTFAQLSALLEQLNHFLDQGNPQPEPGLLLAAKNNIPLLRGLKALFFGNTSPAVETNEWVPLMRVSVHAAVGYLTWQNRPQPFEIQSRNGIQIIASLAEVFAAIMQEIPARGAKIQIEDQTLLPLSSISYLPAHETYE